MSNTSPELVLVHVVGIRRQLRFSFVAASMSAKLVPLLLVVITLTSAYKSPKHKIWRQRVITWAFRDPFKLVVNEESRQLVRSLISTAFALWEDALGGRLEFQDASHFVNSEKGLTKPSGVDIDILFAKGIHGDKEAFDGKGNMVAHSGYPPQGILHLDADEDWSFDGSHGVDLRYVMIHEIGHLLGLRHSRKRSSIMSKYYRKLSTGMRIPQVDVQSIKRLYRAHDNNS
ncbi:hypothetical protein Y032_0025g1149 [Ancylostoma ceylanicum]|uniref:Peptidase metallopeptidase domain-containing protein n=1 Tax=Ancylostoma ceylanicum TaxID=53326 RepID=A0A016UV90_9BILA|nr:hypothetical protein Y032_0025g1149 [Ancylostoma ceylanicum]